MAKRFYQLPSLTALSTFEACARQVSFKGAAQELGVTPGAVSRQIKAIEGELGCKLFNRNQRGVELTDAGIELQNSLTTSFTNIATTCRSIQFRGYRSDVTIAATTAFASLWLMPKLSEFWRRHQQITINHAISDNPSDIAYHNSDIRIRYGDGEWPGEVSRKLFDDVIYPVCGNGFGQVGVIKKATQLLDHQLLQLDGLDPHWTTWETWFKHWDVKTAKHQFRRFTNYLIALQAAEDNQGITLGWHSLVEPLIEQGRLKPLNHLVVPAPSSFYLTWNKHQTLSNDAQLVKQWLLSAR